MSPDEKRAYQRGYNAGRNGQWPKYLPPRPSDPVWERVLRSLDELRNAADGICAQLDADDDFVTLLGPRIDEADAAFAEAQSEHLKDVVTPASSPAPPASIAPPSRAE